MNKIFFILILLISISTFAQNKKSLLRDGNKLYSDSSYNEAEIKYRKSLTKDQDYFNASFNLADAIYKQERYNESSTIFDALKDNASSEENLGKIYHNLGNSLVKEKKLEEGINAYKEALRINPDDDDTRHNLALTQRMKENQDNKKENQDNKKENQDNQKENQDNQKENQDNKKEKNNNKDEISKESAEKMLEAIQQKEKDLQKKLQKKKVKGKKTTILKDW